MFGKVKAPDPSAFADGLALGVWPEVVAALARLRDAENAHQRAAQRLSMAVVTCDQVTADVRVGRASVRDLEAALTARQAAALVADRCARGVAEADGALKAARLQAAKDIVAEAGRRRDKLQVVADELRPELERLRDCEAALDDAVRQITRDTLTTTGTQLGGPVGVSPVDWPGPLASGWPGGGAA